MSSVDWVPELAAALDGFVPLEDGSPADWDDVVARAGTRRRLSLGRRPARRSLRVAIVLALLFLLVACAATATYLLLRGPAGLVFPRTQDGSFAVLDASGHRHDIWRCPPDLWCGDLAGAALSPDGQQLAISTTEIGARSTYPGLHIFDLETGTDLRIPALRRYAVTASMRTLRRVVRGDERALGCAPPSYLSWSPDGSRLAYSCWDRRTGWRIYTIRPDGTGRRLVPTHALRALAPTWSPDGTQIAFSTGRVPSHSSIYVVDLTSGHDRRLAAGAIPDWSPDGKTIAYAAPGCGGSRSNGGRIRLVSLDGRDATPSHGACAGIGPPGSRSVAWSPDGSRLGVETWSALYVMNADGTGLERLFRGDFLGSFGGLLRPQWERPK